MMEIYDRESNALPGSDLVEIRFEDLEEDPMAQMLHIYQTLQLEGFEKSIPYFEAYLDSVRSYRKNVYQYSPRTVELVSKHWKPFMDRWGYEPV